MKNDSFETIIFRSLALREKYHSLEIEHHGSEWTVEEDALAFLTDAALVGRNIMDGFEMMTKHLFECFSNFDTSC